jgi:hypothetical protein
MSHNSYISPWQFKPWWCQPWSILLTGVILILSSWVLWNNIWLTAIAAIPILSWMGYFIVVWPLLVQPYLLQDSLTDPDREKI